MNILLLIYVNFDFDLGNSSNQWFFYDKSIYW